MELTQEWKHIRNNLSELTIRELMETTLREQRFMDKTLYAGQFTETESHYRGVAILNELL